MVFWPPPTFFLKSILKCCKYNTNNWEDFSNETMNDSIAVTKVDKASNRSADDYRYDWKSTGHEKLQRANLILFITFVLGSLELNENKIVILESN
jgi:hypothetical protein